MNATLHSDFGLSQLFGANGRSEFLERCWPLEPHVSHGPIDRFMQIAQVLELQDTEGLLRALDAPVDILGRNGRRATVARPLDALDAYRADEVMIYVTGLRKFAAIDAMCTALAAELGVPDQFVTCEGFAANAGVDVSLHFDHESNFMIQIRGDKTWRFARNTALVNPLFAFFPDNPNRFYRRGTHPYTGEPLPTTMPEDARVEVARPGTAIFLPRGFWHQTRTHTESFSIGIVINPPTIADLVVGYLQQRLHRSARWRAHPLRAGDDVSSPAVAGEIAGALAELQTLLATVDGGTIADAYRQAIHAPPRLLYPIGADWELQRPPRDGA